MELKYKSWNDITVNVFEELKNIPTSNGDVLEDLNSNISLLSILCDVDEDEIAELTTTEFNQLLKQTAFLADMPKVKIIDKYNINGNKYNVHLAVADMTMNQYIDFQTFCKDKEKYMKNLIACFLIPEGKKYCDGYKIEDVIKDIGDMPITAAHSIMFFFIILFQSLTKATLRCSERKLKKAMKKMNKEEQEKTEMVVKMLREIAVSVGNGDGLIG